MALGSTGPVETKVSAATVAAVVSAFVVWVLRTYVFKGDVPPEVEAFATFPQHLSPHPVHRRGSGVRELGRVEPGHVHPALIRHRLDLFSGNVGVQRVNLQHHRQIPADLRLPLPLHSVRAPDGGELRRRRRRGTGRSVKVDGVVGDLTHKQAPS
jgi:hypothetical protein